jgi:hypothetical protein
MAEPISSLLRRSVEHLCEEAPASQRLTLDALGPLVVALVVDDEAFSLSGGRALAVTDGDTDTAGVRITTSRSTILDVLDGRLDLRDAVDTGAIGVLGSLDDVLRVHDTLHAYVHAAIRAPSQSGLLDALRGGRP